MHFGSKKEESSEKVHWLVKAHLMKLKEDRLSGGSSTRCGDTKKNED